MFEQTYELEEVLNLTNSEYIQLRNFLTHFLHNIHLLGGKYLLDGKSEILRM